MSYGEENLEEYVVTSFTVCGHVTLLPNSNSQQCQTSCYHMLLPCSQACSHWARPILDRYLGHSSRALVQLETGLEKAMRTMLSFPFMFTTSCGIHKMFKDFQRKHGPK